MSEKLVIVPRKISGGHKAATIIFFVLTCLSLVAAMLLAPTLFLIPAIIFVCCGMYLDSVAIQSMSIHTLMGNSGLQRLRTRAEERK